MMAPMQGTAADIIKLAMIRTDEFLQASSYAMSMIMQVHDELILDVAKSEIVFQTFFFPLDSFVEENPMLDPTCIDEIRFIFDKTGDGVVIIDNIGFWDPVEN